MGSTKAEQEAAAQHQVQDPQIIPPPTELLLDEEQTDEQRSNSAQMSGHGSINVTSKRPVVRMTAINFI